MQYILSEEEMEEVRQIKSEHAYLRKRHAKVNVLQKMCSKIADEWPTFTGWDKKNPQHAEPWGCILTADYEHCCDECLVQSICPNERKSWSK